MKKIFQKHKIELEENEYSKFEKFLEIFMEKNSKINLSAIRDKDGIIEKHFIDSIMLNIFVELTPLLDKEGLGVVKVLDLGTGGGFPLIPLAVINPKVDFVGLDSVGKKLKAIEGFAEQLELKNVSTINGRAEDLGQDPKHREKYDYVVSRATAYLPTLLELVIPFLKVGGTFVAYKLADKEELRASKKHYQD
ncbi:MAG: 16S rRNA (guanine(527)-N(7))-methyltransferase RsmG [Candidatus Gracilibacteria bacterium]|nr:16S rRNA (guanine(527)-N(7))-methyltransferase RsmG [Candidatus Gracilibacteria bacterium]